MVKDYKQALKASEAEKETLAAKLIKYEVFLLVHALLIKFKFFVVTVTIKF